MSNRKKIIDWEMSYCQHYQGFPEGPKCNLGHNLKEIMMVLTGISGMRMSPCIHGETLPYAQDYCPDWIRRTREQGEEYANKIEADEQNIRKLAPIINVWRKKKPIGKSEIIDCPVCGGGRLLLRQSSINGHVWGKCETEDCISWIE